MEDTTRRRPGRPSTRGHLGALSAKDPIEVLPPTALNILSAARRILERDGFSALSLSAIAAEAGEAKASIGYHFGNKEGLIVALLDSLVHEANRGLIAETRRYPMGEQRVRSLMEGEERIVEDRRRVLAVEILPHAMRDESLRAHRRAYAGYRETVSGTWPLHRSRPRQLARSRRIMIGSSTASRSKTRSTPTARTYSRRPRSGRHEARLPSRPGHHRTA